MASVLASGVYQPVLVLQSRHGAAFQPLRVVQTSCCNSRRAASGSRWAGSNSSSVLPQHLPQGTRSLKPASGPLRAYEGNSSKDPSLEDYVEVRIESVRVSQGASIVYLRVVGSESVIPVHIGENESNALLREINKQRQVSIMPPEAPQALACRVLLDVVPWCPHHSRFVGSSIYSMSVCSLQNQNQCCFQTLIVLGSRH